MPQPHPSHLSIPGKPHYHIWGSTSCVHPQGALLGLALAWALISYLCGTPLYNGASTPPLHPLHPLFSWQMLTFGSGPMPFTMSSFFLDAGLPLWTWTLPGPLENGGPHFCYLWGPCSVDGGSFARRDWDGVASVCLWVCTIAQLFGPMWLDWGWDPGRQLVYHSARFLFLSQCLPAMICLWAPTYVPLFIFGLVQPTYSCPLLHRSPSP
jgi:hypothetical protein